MSIKRGQNESRGISGLDEQTDLPSAADSVLPLVSVIVPIYKVGPYIRKCLDSLSSQTYRHFETILVDDASPDDSMVAARRSAMGLPLVKEILLEANGGLGNARNLGIDAAEGKYILFLDSDDWLAPNAIAEVVARAETGRNQVVIMDYYRAYANGSLQKAKDRSPYSEASRKSFNPEQCQKALHIINLAQIKLYDRAFLLKHKFRFTSGVIYEDVDWTFKIMTTATRVAVVDKPLYYYRSARPGSILSTQGMRHFDILSQYERVFKHLERNHKDIFFETIYNYAINAIHSVLIDHERIPLHAREDFFHKAKAIFKAARGHRTFKVKLYGRHWFDAILMDGTYAELLSMRAQRKKAHLRNASPRWQYWRSTLAYRVGIKLLGHYEAAKAKIVQTRAAVAKKSQETAHNLLRKLPARDVVVFESYWGQQFSDSPKYIYEYLRKNHPNVRCVVALKDDVKAKVRKTDRVRWCSLRYHYYLATAKVFVNNNNFPSTFAKPVNSVFIQTFHGIPIKYVGTDMIGYEDGGKTNWPALVDRCANWDYFISAGAHHTEAMRGAFQVNSKFIEVGSPRTDCLQDPEFRQRHRDQIRRKLKLPLDALIIFYAPTWRLASRREFLGPIYLKTLAETLGRNVYVIARHHHLSPLRVKNNSRVFDMSDYPDGQHICAAADLMITDYSSIAFDFVMTGKPAIFYTSDYDDYRKARGLYFNMEKELGGLVHRTKRQLTEACAPLLFDRRAADLAVSRIRDSFCEMERPDTCRHVVERLILPHLGMEVVEDVTDQPQAMAAE